MDRYIFLDRAGKTKSWGTYRISKLIFQNCTTRGCWLLKFHWQKVAPPVDGVCWIKIVNKTSFEHGAPPGVISAFYRHVICKSNFTHSLRLKGFSVLFLCLPQLFPIIWIKSITENWKLKNFMHFFTCLKPFKVLLYNALCEMELPRKFEFFPIFHYKTILFSSESEFSMKNVFFWGTSWWYSSKIRNVEGGRISCNCSLWAPLPIS